MDRRKSTQTPHDTRIVRRGTIQFTQLLCALALFLFVFLGKRIFPERMIAIGGEVLTVLNQTTNFEEMFAKLGDAMISEDGPFNGIGDLCIEVFSPRTEETVQPTESISPVLPTSPVGILSEQLASAGEYLNFLPEPSRRPVSEEAPVLQETKDTPAVGTVLIDGQAADRDLPAGYTADKLSLGELNTVSPVRGVLTSPFGYRDHPVKGELLFHGGVDINGRAGDVISAFADGIVEYVGEDDSYGLYFQLDHGSGIKSFYAHCKSVRVKKGQRVSMGETVAIVGSSGTTTGPHLHLELKCGDLRVDPAYYIEFLGV